MVNEPSVFEPLKFYCIMSEDILVPIAERFGLERIWPLCQEVHIVGFIPLSLLDG